MDSRVLEPGGGVFFLVLLSLAGAILVVVVWRGFVSRRAKAALAR